MPPGGATTVCDRGCSYDIGLEVGGPHSGEVGASPNGNLCNVTPTNTPTLDPDTDGDGVTDQNDDFPNDPTETTDSDGDGVGDNGDNAPDDPDNGSDDGSGDETDNTSSGGGTCSSAPVSQGDGLLAQIAFQAWRTRCAVEAVTEAGSLKVKVQNWPAGGSTITPGDPLNMDGFDPNAVGNTTEGGAHPDSDGLFEDLDLGPIIAAGPDETVFSGSTARSCPLLDLPASLDLSFGSVAMPWVTICTALQVLSAMILLAGYIQWAYIVARIGS